MNLATDRRLSRLESAIGVGPTYDQWVAAIVAGDIDWLYQTTRRPDACKSLSDDELKSAIDLIREKIAETEGAGS